MTLEKRFYGFVHPIFILSMFAAQACAAAPPPPTTPRTPVTTAALVPVSPLHSLPSALPLPVVKEAHSDTRPLAADMAALRKTLETRISPDGNWVRYALIALILRPSTKTHC